VVSRQSPDGCLKTLHHSNFPPRLEQITFSLTGCTCPP
jgi:hypothetical protein